MPENKVRVSIFCDYAVPFAQGIWDYPLYCDDENADAFRYCEDFYTFCEADVPVLHDLFMWNEQYDLYYDDFLAALEEDQEIDREIFDPDKFTEMGKCLAFRIKVNHPDWEVRFYDEVGSDRRRCRWKGQGTADTVDTNWYLVDVSSSGERILHSLAKCLPAPEGLCTKQTFCSSRLFWKL